MGENFKSKSHKKKKKQKEEKKNNLVNVKVKCCLFCTEDKLLGERRSKAYLCARSELF